MWAVFSPARTQEKDQWPSVQHVLSVSKKISENQSNRVPSVTLMSVIRCRSAVCCFRIPLACPKSLRESKRLRIFAPRNTANRKENEMRPMGIARTANRTTNKGHKLVAYHVTMFHWRAMPIPMLTCRVSLSLMADTCAAASNKLA